MHVSKVGQCQGLGMQVDLHGIQRVSLQHQVLMMPGGLAGSGSTGFKWSLGAWQLLDTCCSPM